MKVCITLPLVFLVCLLSICANASDLDLGSTARSVGMGGAGIALGDDLAGTTVLNPAAPALAGQGFRLIWPGLGFHSTGASFDELTDSVSDLRDSDSESALKLVNDFGKHLTTLSVSSVAGLAGPLGVFVEGQANGIIAPGAAAMEWANADLDFASGTFDLTAASSDISNTHFQAAITAAEANDLATANAQFALYANDLSDNHVDAQIVYGPSFTFARPFHSRSGKLWVGTNVRFLKGRADRWQITATPSGSVAYNGTTVTAGMDFDAVEAPEQESDTVKADIGCIFRPKNSRVQYGFVVNNLIEPDFEGMTTLQGDRMFSFGVAATPVKGIVVAADLINITGANDEDAQLRFGGEWNVGSLFALRAGYSGSSWTYGIKAFGLNLAFSGKDAQLLANVLKF